VDARPPEVGLYSNGVRGLGLEEFLDAAAAHRVPFVHLRGGPRGYGLADAPAEQVTALARQAAGAVPVCGRSNGASGWEPSSVEHPKALLPPLPLIGIERDMAKRPE
jgi:hypothetical protein